MSYDILLKSQNTSEENMFSLFQDSALKILFVTHYHKRKFCCIPWHEKSTDTSRKCRTTGEIMPSELITLSVLFKEKI